MLYLPALLIHHRFTCPIKNALRSFRRTRKRVLQPSSRWGRLTHILARHVVRRERIPDRPGGRSLQGVYNSRIVTSTHR